MGKYYLLVFILYTSTHVKAQDWTANDSIWLKKVLSGEEKLQLNDEAKKAIRSGTLFSPDPHIKEQLKMDQAELPIIKSFEGITSPEYKRKLPYELPPSVYKLYGLDIKDSIPDATRSMIFYEKTITNLKASSPKGTATFDAEDLLRTIFWPSHRAKQRNKKNANAHKTYNNGY